MNWKLLAETLSIPYLSDDLYGIQEQLQGHNLHILDLGIQNFWADTQSTPYLANKLLGLQEPLQDHTLYIQDLELALWADMLSTPYLSGDI